eukprot:6470473-Amphidinium_carterae.2
MSKVSECFKAKDMYYSLQPSLLGFALEEYVVPKVEPWQGTDRTCSDDSFTIPCNQNPQLTVPTEISPHKLLFIGT